MNIGERVEELERRANGLYLDRDVVNDRLQRLEEQFEGHGDKLEGMEDGLDFHSASLEKAKNRLELVDDRLDNLVDCVERTEHGLDFHDAWLQKVDARFEKVEDRLATLEITEQRGDYQAGYKRGREDGRKDTATETLQLRESHTIIAAEVEAYKSAAKTRSETVERLAEERDAAERRADARAEENQLLRRDIEAYKRTEAAQLGDIKRLSEELRTLRAALRNTERERDAALHLQKNTERWMKYWRDLAKGLPPAQNGEFDTSGF